MAALERQQQQKGQGSMDNISSHRSSSSSSSDTHGRTKSSIKKQHQQLFTLAYLPISSLHSVASTTVHVCSSQVGCIYMLQKWKFEQQRSILLGSLLTESTGQHMAGRNWLS